VLQLISDVGGGKTTFTKGLVRGAGSSDIVTSPTFMVSKVYDCPRFAIHHFDFYRLSDAGIVQQELAELVNDEIAVVVVEWGDTVVDSLGDGIVRIRFECTAASEKERIITIEHPESNSYLLDEVSL
jgi:tRNA threonylcarbamoyladenosine biosynthesis protein TsaE